METIIEHIKLNFGTYDKMEIINQSETEIVFNTTHKGVNATIQAYRVSHKPLELQLKVEFSNSYYSQEAFKKSSGLGAVGGAFKWIIIIFACSILLSIFFVITQIVSFNTGGQGILIILLLLMGLILYQARSGGSQKTSNLQQRELRNLMDRLKFVLQTLQTHETEKTKKCWNCFGDVSLTDNVCAYCGKPQN